MKRLILNVSSEDIDKTRSLGALYDILRKYWYIPDNHLNIKAFLPWLELDESEKLTLESKPKELFKNEDRTFGDGLFVDLIPAGCWFTNVRSCVSPLDWKRIRTFVVNRANNQCEVCHADPVISNHLYMEVHERWEYIQENNKNTQRLKRLICLCSKCHKTTHMGYAEVSGKGEQAIKHLMKVKNISRERAVNERNEAFKLWDKRNKYHWTLDISLISDAGLTILKPENR